ncbi:hypothetical protein ACFW9N_32800 [Streptomyces sp. NPDC059496]|uniref:hypothetical protein n=1 Tax=Streptomyces sp. NPDC059496 TaxID=3346851 RepID=UPI0036C122E4
MRKGKLLLAAAAFSGEIFVGYSLFSVQYGPDMLWSMGLTFAAFALSVSISLTLATRGNNWIGPAIFIAVGLGILASEIGRGEIVNSLAGVILVAVGLLATLLIARVSPFSLRGMHGDWGLGGVPDEGPRERHTRLCRITDLDERLLPLLEDTAHKFSLGDLRAAARLCCETRYSDNGILRRGAYVGSPPVIEACILTEKLVIILTVFGEGRGYAYAGRLQQTTLSKSYGQKGSWEEDGPYIHSAWLGSSEASSHQFPLDDTAASKEFMEEFHEMLTAARHT